MKKLVRPWERPSYDGQKYTYYLIYYDPDGRRKQKALGHADKRKAEKQCAQLTRELRMETVEADSMRLSEFLQDSLERTRATFTYWPGSGFLFLRLQLFPLRGPDVSVEGAFFAEEACDLTIAKNLTIANLSQLFSHSGL